MIDFIVSTLVVLGLSTQAHGQQATGRIVEGTIFPGIYNAKNYIKNPSAFKNAAAGTAVSSATLTRDTTAANKIDDISSFICDSSALNGYCEWNIDAISPGDKTGLCEARILYKGDAQLYKLQITDTSSVLASTAVLTNAADWTQANLTFACGSARSVRFTQTQAGTGPAVNVGRVNYSKSLGSEVLTTKGDLLAHDGFSPIRLPVGTDSYVLAADSTQAAGFKWTASGGANINEATFPLDGPYASVIGTSANDQGQRFIAPFDIQITKVCMYVKTKGTSGTTTLDLKKATKAVPNTFATIFSTSPAATTTITDGEFKCTGDTGTGWTIPVMSPNPFLMGQYDTLRLDVTGVMTGSEDVGLVIFYQPQ